MPDTIAPTNFVRCSQAHHSRISQLIAHRQAQVRHRREIVVIPGRLEVRSVFEALPEGLGLLIVGLEMGHVDISAALAQLTQFVLKAIQLRLGRLEIGLQRRRPTSPPGSYLPLESNLQSAESQLD